MAVHSSLVFSRDTWLTRIYITCYDQPFDSYSYTTVYSCPQNAKAGDTNQCVGVFMH